MLEPAYIVRIDDRLIHGQVMVGWCNHYPIKKFIVCDDAILENEWEKNLLLTAVPSGYPVKIFSAIDACKFIKANPDSPDLSMVLVNSPQQFKKMADFGLPIKKINIGGIHYKEDRKQYLLYLFLNPNEVEIFKKLMDKDYIFECQDLPTNAKYNLKKILEA